jgi:hypothetical protein
LTDHSDATAPRAAETDETDAKQAQGQAPETAVAEAAPARKKRAPSAKTLAARAA